MIQDVLFNQLDTNFDVIAFFPHPLKTYGSPSLSKIHPIKPETEQRFPSEVVAPLVMVCLYVKFMSLQALFFIL